MTKKIKVGSGGLVSLTDSNYVAAGGEGEIYKSGGMAYKLYHDPATKMLPIKKIQELSSITSQQVIVPKDIIYDTSSGNPIGYSTVFVENTEPLLKFFTRTFKDLNGITHQMITELVNNMQSITSTIHTSKCLIVDYNELNVLVRINNSTLVPYYIDTDSYSTPSYKATAIMDSVRDRKVTIYDKDGKMHYNPTIESDWYSWAILTFYLYTNIHPYRGTHINYKPKDKRKQMDDGISIFHPGVRVPPSVNDFKVIPPRHLDWYKQVFLKGDRGIPPISTSTIPVLVPTQIITIKGTDKLSTQEIFAYDSQILDVYSILGTYYVATKKNIYLNDKEIYTHNAKNVAICSSNDGTPILALQDNTNKITFKEITKPEQIAFAVSNKMFVRNNSVYTMSNGKLFEHTFISIGNKIIRKLNEIANVSVSTSSIYSGCVIQDLLGKMFLTLPYKQGSCFTKHIPQLDGYRIIDAKSDKNIVVVIGEKSGKYDRFILVYNKDFTQYTFRKDEDVGYDVINFAVTNNGLCVLLSNSDDVELFMNTTHCEVLQNSPFDSTMKLFTTNDGIFFINNNSFHQIKKK